MRFSVALIAIALLVAAAVTPAAALSPWPQTHTHTEVQVSLPQGYVHSVKKWFFDFPSLSLRVDSRPFKSVVGGAFQLTSYWLNDTLTMVNEIAGLRTCVQLQMGFGMMRPDWFIDGATTMPSLYNARIYKPEWEQDYTYTGWTRKSAGSYGYFDYFFDNSTGAPFRMYAPSPGTEVSNEYYDFQEVASFPAGTFDLPAKVNCTVGSSFAVPRKQHAESFAHLDSILSSSKGLSKEAALAMKSQVNEFLTYGAL